MGKLTDAEKLAEISGRIMESLVYTVRPSDTLDDAQTLDEIAQRLTKLEAGKQQVEVRIGLDEQETAELKALARPERGCEVRELVRDEPQWAVNRILQMEKQLPALQALITTLQADTARLTEERDEARVALAWCAETVWEGHDIDGGSFQDYMEEKGLLVEVPASDYVKKTWDTDVMFTWRWIEEESSDPTVRSAREGE